MAKHAEGQFVRCFTKPKMTHENPMGPYRWKVVRRLPRLTEKDTRPGYVLTNGVEEITVASRWVHCETVGRA
jgi:hypothetical protein